MTYRRLTDKELKGMEQKFVQFLVSNTITADDWQQIQKDKPEKAEEIINIFSDFVFETSITQLRFIEFQMPDEWVTFFCPPQRIYRLSIKQEGEPAVDFTEFKSLSEAIRIADQNLLLSKSDKTYENNNRNQEIFKMMEKGCLVTDGANYQTLETIKHLYENRN